MKYNQVNRKDAILKLSSLNFLVFILLNFHNNPKESIFVLYLLILAIFEMKRVSLFLCIRVFYFWEEQGKSGGKGSCGWDVLNERRIYFQLEKNVLKCFTCKYSEPNECLMPSEAKRGQQIPWDWSYRQLGAIIYGCWDPYS